MKEFLSLGSRLHLALIVASVAVFTGCSSIHQETREYLGTPHFAPTDPASVKVLPSKPQQPFQRVGEINLIIYGNPPRPKIENVIRTQAGSLGADAAYIGFDGIRSYPVVYGDYWWGPTGVYEERRREIAAIAIRHK